MEVASYPSLTPLHLHCKESKASSFLLPMRAHKGVCVGCSPYKQEILRNSYSPARNGFLCVPKKRVGVSWLYSHPKEEEFNRTCYDNKQYNRKKLPRYVVVRSELAGTGSPASAYPLSEVKFGSKVRGMCFYAVTSVIAIFLIVPMLVGHPLVLLLDRYRRKFHHFIAKLWAILTVSPFLKVEIEGLENLLLPDTPAVYVSNHQSFLDIYILLTLGRNFKFISKTGIFLFPVIGWAMSMLSIIPLKRMNSRSQLECLKKCMALIKNGSSVFFFPEGTRSKDGTLGAFKKGAFTVASKTGAPMVPMTLMGTGKIMPYGMEGILNTGSVKVVIHKPIQGSDPTVLCSEARKTILDTLNLEG
ncbi:hypothetical protein Dsin_029223 [Dipteronia sinensis]|uniref:Phospholipid/glycerol acyltransferase domain-containing protein n=1 Tax=Dipteronia sinensis TaxID=43782 RepID=A0AAD9ZS90_9ROSI|nr:hypothetical protein Dsin_029223 [Dipteronia sinensis]